ncbi:hypothetical protein BDN72DRAFT_964856 [Pluteus cervinus]|uniref:Uncharacterized protein n=1 Tax=Pluteus cervinus TaxID=181527 RepID=A0ACD3A984_9AGAR|nr:hypothetical protein BDN72DRAFT_964856 [Pluteus cervinus]
MLMNGVAPKLECLVINYFPVKLDKLICSKKLKFSLKNSDTYRIPIRILFRILSQSNHLRTLQLTHALRESDDTEPASSDQPLTLQDLKEFILEAGVIETRTLLLNLVLSTASKISITISGPETFDSLGDLSPQSILDLIGHRLDYSAYALGGWNEMTILSGCGVVYRFEIIAAREVNPIEREKVESRVLVVEFRSDVDTTRDWFPAPHSFQTTSVRHLELSCRYGELCRDVTSSFFSAFPSISSLSLSGAYVDAFSDFVCNQTQGSEIFPFLERVCVYLPQAHEELLESFWKALHYRSRMSRDHKKLKELKLIGEKNLGGSAAEIKIKVVGVVDNLIVE